MDPLHSLELECPTGVVSGGVEDSPLSICPTVGGPGEFPPSALENCPNTWAEDTDCLPYTPPSQQAWGRLPLGTFPKVPVGGNSHPGDLASKNRLWDQSGFRMVVIERQAA